MKKQKTNKVKTVVYLIHFILIDIWARNGVLHIFSPPPKHISYIPRPIEPIASIATSYLYQCVCLGDRGSVVKPTAPLESAPTRSRLVRSLAAQ